MGYVVGESFFFKHALDKIDQKALQAFTAKCGYNRNLAYAICDGPSHLEHSLTPKTPPKSTCLGPASVWHIGIYSMGKQNSTSSPQGKMALFSAYLSLHNW
eukprot:9166508-Ditylum_brightwellii.AAC.1